MTGFYQIHRCMRDFRERIYSNSNHDDLVKDRPSVLRNSERHGSGERHGQYHQHIPGESGDKPAILFCHNDSKSGGA